MMAKSRRSAGSVRAKKKGSSKSSRTKAAKKAGKAAKAKASKPARKAAAPKVVELKKLREQFAAVVTALTARRSDSPEVEAKLDDARRRISQWMTDVDDICSPDMQEICGPDMAFPMP
jgi:hypothetical protein